MVAELRQLRGVACLGLVAVSLSCLACDGAQLEPWHEAVLAEEFTAAKSESVQSFRDYEQLEEKLFEALKREVYAHVERGARERLVRYSSGSAADPEIRTPNWNRSFELSPPSPVGGVLLLHGMSDSPYSLRALAKALGAQGYRVLGLRMPGHGTAPSALVRLDAEDMRAAVRLGMTHLGRALGGKPVHVIGYSTGATLALNFAVDAVEGRAAPIPASLVLISPAIGIHPAAALARLKDSLSILPGLGGLAWLQILPEFDPYKYNSFATNASDLVHRLTESVNGRVAALVQSERAGELPPMLIFKSTVDATVTNEAVVGRLLSRLPPRRNELVLFDINRAAAKSSLLVADPGPWTQRLMADASLPFAIRLVTNVHDETNAVVVRYKAAFSGGAQDEARPSLAWPPDVLSLSHVALPFPPDDPLYGEGPPTDPGRIFLGDLALRGERGLIDLPPEFQLRMRYNPFYEVVERRCLDWLAAAQATASK